MIQHGIVAAPHTYYTVIDIRDRAVKNAMSSAGSCHYLMFITAVCAMYTSLAST